MKKFGIAAAVVLIAAALICLVVIRLVVIPEPSEKTPGQIFLYGEHHSDEFLLEAELEIWYAYYHDNGMRDLFVEYPYYSAEYLNLWLQSDSDDILDQIFEDIEGTAAATEQTRAFFERIKEECPETVFHGTDVGHQYATTGQRFLAYLEETGQKQSEAYVLTQTAIKQGEYYYAHDDGAYRENMMAQNFIREFDALDGVDVMGIYGGAHTGLKEMDSSTNTVPCMANQLAQHYGDILYVEDLFERVRRVDEIELGGKTYEASYFGRMDLSYVFPEYQYREFWRLEDAYDDFKDCPTTSQVLPYNNYPMTVTEGQVFVIDYTLTDGSIRRDYYRSDGDSWLGMPTTKEFVVVN